MTLWEDFGPFAAASLLLLAAGAAAGLRRSGARTAAWLFGAGGAVLAAFVGLMWIRLGYPPLRTTGQTRLFYSLCVAGCGWVLFLRWRYRFLLPATGIVASVFILIDLLQPQAYADPLMPALQSAWFFPHVAVYMVAYALCACAAAVGLAAHGRHRTERMRTADTLMRIAAALMLVGMLTGALWAARAWGRYWDWDPKESWAAATWLLALAYLHLRKWRPQRRLAALVLIVATFLAMQVTWWGVDYLPAARESLHTYTRTR